MAPPTPQPPRDRLRELLDAVLDPGHGDLTAMARAVYSSPFGFARQVSAAAGEPPVRMRRRVLLERAAWQLRGGARVTDAAFDAGYTSVEGFSRAFARAFGHPPSEVGAESARWLPAPNGVHFHPPSSVWINRTERSVNPVLEHLVAHDLDDTRYLLEAAKALPEEEYDAVRLPGHVVLCFEGPEESIADVLRHHVRTKEIWLAAIDGTDFPADDPADLGALIDLHDRVAPRWLAFVRGLDSSGGWDDVLIDALCEPPESFVMGAVVAHVLTYAAHRRTLARSLLRIAGVDTDEGDPIEWQRRQQDLS